MNIDQYRAIKAEEQKEKEESAPAQEETKSQQEATPTQEPTSTQETNTNEETKSEEKPPEKVNIDGVGEVSFEELKNGYLRQSDYTKKTQELSQKDKELQKAKKLYDQLQKDPKTAQEVAKSLPQVDPKNNKVNQLEEKVYDMMLQQEINNLQNKYDDFEVKEVLEMAQEKKMTNLEDAYFLVKSRKGEDKGVSKDELKKEILEEMKNEGVTQKSEENTQTIISSNDSAPVTQDNSPKLSSAEQRVARNMNLSDEEYVKWRDAGKKKK